MSRQTRDKFLDTAEALFAERGFYGVSIAAVSDELGLTKQALLHHFGSKEKLYGEVLARLSARYEAILTAANNELERPAGNLLGFMHALHQAAAARPSEVRLLMRELLDNKNRADSAANWYLQPFLARLIAMVQAVPNWADATDAEALAFVYQLLGAVNYHAISAPTLTGIFGAGTIADMNAAFPATLEGLLMAGLRARKGG